MKLSIMSFQVFHFTLNKISEIISVIIINALQVICNAVFLDNQNIVPKFDER